MSFASNAQRLPLTAKARLAVGLQSAHVVLATTRPVDADAVVDNHVGLAATARDRAVVATQRLGERSQIRPQRQVRVLHSAAQGLVE